MKIINPHYNHPMIYKDKYFNIYLDTVIRSLRYRVEIHEL